MSSKEEAMAKRRENVIQEIISTEHKYNAGLQMLYTICSDPLHKLVLEQKIVLEHPEIRTLFESIFSIGELSKNLTSSLHSFLTSNGAISIGDCFSAFSPLISVYFQYIPLYHEVAPTLRAERAYNNSLDDFLKKCEQTLSDTVDAFLITPIQRPPRYRLLLQELIKTTPQDSPDYPKLNTALDQICKAINNVDQKIEEFEEAIQMAEIQKRISGFEVIQLGRRLLFHGNAVKFSRKYTNQRYLVLFSDVLLVAETSMMVNLKVNKLFKSGEYLISKVADNPPFVNAIDIRQRDKSFRANLDNAEFKRKILDGFETMKQINHITQTSLEMRGFAPVWIPDDLAPECMECHEKFSLFNRRHHCRSCGNCVCKKCWTHEILIPGLDNTPMHVCDSCYIRLSKMIQEMGNNGELKTNEANPNATNPTEAKEAAKPTEAKTETKPAESIEVKAETKPAEPNESQIKADEAKPPEAKDAGIKAKTEVDVKPVESNESHEKAEADAADANPAAKIAAKED